MTDCRSCSRPMTDASKSVCAECHIECDMREVTRSIKRLSSERDLWRERALKAEAQLTIASKKVA